MIVTEYYKTRKDGVVLNHTFSDSGYMIERDSIRYSAAIDPAEFNRQYTETDEPIEGETDEATETDYQNEMRRLVVDV